MSDTLMISVSGMRGIVGTDLTPELVARHAAALGAWAGGQQRQRPAVVLGRDARTSGPMFARARPRRASCRWASTSSTSASCRRPTVQLAVEHHHAGRRADPHREPQSDRVERAQVRRARRHLPRRRRRAPRVRALAEQGPPRAGWDGLGEYREDPEAIARHLDAVLALPVIGCRPRSGRRRFHVALDCVRGAGGTAIPPLLERLGCRVTRNQPRARRPLSPRARAGPGESGRARPAGSRERCRRSGWRWIPTWTGWPWWTRRGEPIGEDYTLAFAVRAVLDRAAARRAASGTADRGRATSRPAWWWRMPPGLWGARFVRAPVGEANVARAIRDEGAVIGGEGNGGVILPALHIGRDAPLGVALILHLLATIRASGFRSWSPRQPRTDRQG